MISIWILISRGHEGSEPSGAQGSPSPQGHILVCQIIKDDVETKVRLHCASCHIVQVGSAFWQRLCAKMASIRMEFSRSGRLTEVIERMYFSIRLTMNSMFLDVSSWT